MSISPHLPENPLFLGLPSVEQAKLLAELDERAYPAGATIFHAGAPADGLYLLVEGAVEIRTTAEGHEALVTVLRAPDYFGEQALLTGDPRSTTVVALGDVRAACLPKARFDALLARNPGLALHLGRVLSRRLAAARKAISEMRHGFEELAANRLEGVPADQRAFLTRSALLRRLEPAVVNGLLGSSDAAERLEQLERDGIVLPGESPGEYVYPPLLANFLRARLRAEVREPGLRALHGRAAEVLAARGDWAEAAHHYRAAGRGRDAEEALLGAGRALLGGTSAAGVRPRNGRSARDSGGSPVALESTYAGAEAATTSSAPPTVGLREWLATVNALGAGRRGELLTLRLAAFRALGDATGERVALEAAVSAPRSGLSPTALAAAYERLSELAEARNDRAAGARYLDLALALEPRAAGPSTEPPPPATSVPSDGSLGAGRLAYAADRSFRLAAVAGQALDPLRQRRLLGLLLAALIGLVFLSLPVPADLSREAWTTLALLATFIPILVLEVVPDYIAALLLTTAWAGLGLVPPRVALSGFGSATWLLVLTVLGLGAAVARSGLLYRAALLALTHLPPTHTAQGLALAALGTVFTPGMPNATARVAMAGPLTMEIADALGYPRDSAPRAGVALATLFGFGLMAGLFLTGSSTGLLVHGVLPPDVRAEFTWGTWLVAAWPLHLVILLVGLIAALRFYRPHGLQPVPRERLALQWRILGRPSRAERITLGVFVLVLVGFVSQPLHHVDPAWVGLIGLCTLLATGALDQNTFRSGVNWPFLLYLGVLVGLGEVFVYLKLDAWLASRLGDLLAPLGGNALVFATALTIACFVLSFVVRWQAAAVLVTLVLGPVAPALGMNPWVIGMIALVATNAWFVPYQSTIYLALYYGMDESFSHRSVRPIAWAYAAAVLVGVALSLPYWQALGLVR